MNRTDCRCSLCVSTWRHQNRPYASEDPPACPHSQVRWLNATVASLVLLLLPFTSSYVVIDLVIYSLACPSYSQEAKAAFQTACRREWQAEHDASPLDYPVTALEALNQVLFERHGYTKPEFHHNNSPDNSLLPKVLEQGKGSPLLLGVVYMEVAHRMGLPLEGAPLSEGKSVTN
eukprot:56945-Pyramimonas_sp.AAC.1